MKLQITNGRAFMQIKFTGMKVETFNRKAVKLFQMMVIILIENWTVKLTFYGGVKTQAFYKLKLLVVKMLTSGTHSKVLIIFCVQGVQFVSFVKCFVHSSKIFPEFLSRVGKYWIMLEIEISSFIKNLFKILVVSKFVSI